MRGTRRQVRQYAVTLEEAAGLSAKAAEAPAVAPEALGAPGASASHPELPPTAIDISAGFTERVARERMGLNPGGPHAFCS